MDFYKRITERDDFPANIKHYWGYQYRLGKEVLVPYLQKQGIFQAGKRVVEIGCAEAGVLMAFVEAGAEEVLGTDIEGNRLEYGRQIADALQLPLTLSTHNVVFDELQPDWQQAFDIVILRDVIEHLDNTELALRNIQRLLKPGGQVFIEFPPYSSPFGGHQHLLRNRWGKFPYIHLLPKFIFKAMTNSGWHPIDIEEVRRLADIRLTVKRFKRAASAAGYSIADEQYEIVHFLVEIHSKSI